ncbi:unnamed protein product [Rhizophagus irregularis]|nr:unnamed protein product [Rhizophagus irregularis]
MSKDTKTKDLNYYIDWLKKSIDNENIKLYEYQSFKDIQWKGSGSYGNVYRVNLENSNRLFALKSFVNVNNKQTFEEVLKELKLHRSVDCHENIIRLYGITNVKFDAIQNCSFVLEYADSGTLNTYLTDHFSELDWSDKYHLASQLASAIEFLHGEDIIHRDLHGDNILINQKNIKLADFGLSKKIIEASSSTSKVLGVMPYVDPKSFDDKEKYKLNKKSDVYSVGVLLWQISSGYKPFHEVDHSVSLMLSILKGKREKIIDGTPVKYSDLYRECWRGEPNKRPNIREVVSTLKSIIEIDTTTDHTNEKKETHSRNEDEIISESSKRTKDLNDELMPNSELNSIPSGSNKKFEGSINEIIISKDESNIIKEDENRMASNQKYGSPSNANASDQVNQVTGSSISLINFLDVDKLIAFIIKKHDNGITFDQAQQLISEHYAYGEGVDKDERKAFELFNKLAKESKYLSSNKEIEMNKRKDFDYSKIFVDDINMNSKLGNCYDKGIGTEINKKKAFKLYKIAAEKGENFAQNSLGFLYEYGEAAVKGYVDAQYQLGYCYYEGIGTEIDKANAFEYYKIAAENGNNYAQNSLGFLYGNGEGTKKNLEKAFYWYNKAAENGNRVAQYSLGECYELGNGVKKDEIKAFEYNKKSAENGHISAKFQLGYYYVNGIGTEIDKEKGFELYNEAAGSNIQVDPIENDEKLASDLGEVNNWYHKAAEDDNKLPLFKLGNFYELGKGVCKNKVRAFEFYKKSADQGFSDAQYKVDTFMNELGLK